MKDEAYYLSTIPGRLAIRWELAKWAVRHKWPERFWMGLAYRLPRQLVLWALIRVAAGTYQGNPEEFTYETMYRRWEAGQGR